MARFTPSDRAEVHERTEDQEWVDTVEWCGPGLVVTVSQDVAEITTFTTLAEEHGWYVDQLDTAHSEIVLTVMPFPDGDLQ